LFGQHAAVARNGGLEIYLERSTYSATEDLHWSCVSGSPFQRQSRQRAVPGEAHEDHRRQLLEPKEVSASLQTQSAPKVAQQSASILDQVIHSNWGGMGLERACLTCPAVPVSIKLHQLRVGPAAGGSLCNSDRPRAANTAGNKWPCKRFSKRFGIRDAGQRSTKPPKPRDA
jgi:hypothetical protein